MNRQVALIAGLVALVLIVAFYFFAWQPKSDEIAEIDAQREAVLAEQQQLEQRINELREIRATAPEAEAAIVAAESIVPRDVALPSALRQLQVAADEAGVELPTVSVARPAQIVDAQPGLAEMGVTLTVNGSYYQIVDFLRRVEDPAITPRGLTWTTVSVGPADYPELSASISGEMYALLPTPPAPPAEEEVPAEGEAEEEPVAIGGASS